MKHMPMMMMPMSFSWSTRPGPILFKSLEPESDGAYWLAIFVVIAFAALSEVFAAFVARMHKDEPGSSTLLLGGGKGSFGARRSPRQRAILACLHAARAGVALLLMLIAMTFNVGLFLAVLVGYAAGNAAVNGRKGSEEVTPACCE